MRKLFYSLLALSVCFSVSHAEYFYLKSGKVINGKIVSETNNSLTVSVAGTGAKQKIMLFDIEDITKTPKPLPPVSSKETPSSAAAAKTQFTSDLKQGEADGETYVKDNKSGVLIFNVQETVVEKPKAAENVKPAQKDDSFDAALLLIGGDSSANTPSPVATPSKPVKTEAVKSAESKPEPVKANNDDDFDAALFLLSNSGNEPVQQPLATTDYSSKQKQQKNNDYYDPAGFLIEDDEFGAASKSNDAAEKTYQKKESSKKISQKPESETFLAVAFDLKGVNIFSGEVKQSGVKSSADLTENSDYGISLSAEQYGYVSRFAAIGLGIGFQFKRCLEETPGRFGFLPLYGAFKMRFISEENYHFYAVAHLGYNFLLANSDYLDKSETEGGLYYAGGLGASYNKYVFQVLYSVSNASIKYSNSYAQDKIDKDVMYSKIGFYVGYLL